MPKSLSRWLYLLPALLCGQPAHAGTPQTVVLSRIVDETLADAAYSILAEAYRRLHVPMRAKELPAERSLAYANAGTTDGELMRVAGIEADYPNLVRVKVPLVHAQMQAFTTGRRFSVDGWQSLQPYRLCVRNGIRIVMQHTAGMRREITNSDLQLLTMLRAGRCQVAILNRYSWLEIDRLHMGPLRALDPPLTDTPLYHYLNKRHAALVPRLEATLREMQRDHSTQRILQQIEAGEQAARARQSLP